MSLLRKKLRETGAIRFGDLRRDCRKGVQPERYSEEGQIVVVKSKDIGPSDIDYSQCERTDPDALPSREGLITGGELLINMTGQGTLGRGSVVPITENPTVASVDVAIFSVDEDICRPEYLALFFNSPAGQLQAIASQTGSSGQQHLYPEHIDEILIPVARTSNGEVDIAWQTTLVDLVKERHLAQQTANDALEEIDRLVQEALDLEIMERDTIPI